MLKVDPFDTPNDFYSKNDFYSLEDRRNILDEFENFWENNKNLTFKECKKKFCLSK